MTGYVYLKTVLYVVISVKSMAIGIVIVVTDAIGPLDNERICAIQAEGVAYMAYTETSLAYLYPVFGGVNESAGGISVNGMCYCTSVSVQMIFHDGIRVIIFVIMIVVEFTTAVKIYRVFSFTCAVVYREHTAAL